MLATFLQLIDRGIALLREGQSQRRAFFVEAVEPINRQLLQLQELHEKAFDEVSAGLLNDFVSRAEIARKLALAFESQDSLCAMLYELPRAALSDPRSELFDVVAGYTGAIERALRIADADADADPTQRTVIRFTDMGAVLLELQSGRLMVNSRSETEEEQRKRLFAKVQELRRQYNDLFVEIAVTYHALRRKCAP